MNRNADQNSIAFPIAVLVWLVLSLFCLTKFGNADSIDDKEEATRFPQGTADGLVVLVHGCCTNSDELEEWENLRGAFQEGTLLSSFYQYFGQF